MRKSFDIELTIGEGDKAEKRRFKLTPSFQAITEMEGHEIHRRGDGSLMQMLQRFGMQVPRVSDYVAIIHGCLRAAGVTDVTAEEVGEAIVETGMTIYAVPCVQILNEALGIGGRKRTRTPKRGGSKKKAKRT